MFDHADVIGDSCWASTKFVVFDLDGTLVDSLPLNLTIINNIRFQKDMQALSPEEFMPYLSLGAYRIAEAFFPSESADEIVKAFRTTYATSVTSISDVYEGAIAFIQKLKACNINMAICSNKPHSLCEKVLTDIGLIDYFKIIVGGDTLPLNKPNPLPLEHIAALLDQPITRGIFLGDSHIDYEAAYAAGMPYIHHQYGYDMNNEPRKVGTALFNYSQLNITIDHWMENQ